MKVNLKIDKTVAQAPFDQLQEAVIFCGHVIARKSYHINKMKKSEQDERVNMLSLCWVATRIVGPEACERPLEYAEASKFDSALQQADRLSCFVWYDAEASLLKTEVCCFGKGPQTTYRVELVTDANNRTYIE